MRTGPGALIEIAHGNDRRVAVFRVLGEIARGQIGIVGEGGVLGGQSRPVKIGHPDRRAAFARGSPGEERVVLFGDVGFERIAVRGRDFRAVEIFAQNDVHHTCGGVGAVDSGGAVLQHFDALDHGHRETVQVDKRGATGGIAGQHGAAAVDDHQRVVRAEIAQTERSRATNRGGGAALVDADGAGLGEVAQELREIGATARLDVGAGDDLDRGGTFEVHRGNTRTRDFEFFEFLGLVGFFLIVGLLHFLRGENADAEQGRETETGSRKCGRQERFVHGVGL